MQQHMTYRDYARFAAMDADAIARDCRAETFRATGPGGQGVNTTDSAVRMTHLPTGIVVTSRESRSQYQNRASCIRKIRSIIEHRARPPRVRKPTKVPARARERRLKDKRYLAQKKMLRRKLED